MTPGVPDDSDGQKYGKPKVFQRWLLEKGAFTCKFNDFRGSPFSASPIENRDLIFFYQILLIKYDINNRQ